MVSQGRTRRIPLANGERLLVVAASFEEARWLRLKPAILLLEAVGVGAELLQAADGVLDPGAKHAPTIIRNETRTEGPK
jgi:hypothetical protein